MKIGELRHRVTLQYQTKVSDGMGGENVTWADSDTVWAAIWPVSAKEIIQAGAHSMSATHRIRIRYRSDITARWRIRNGSRYYNLTSIVNPEMKNKWLDLVVTEAA